ncbi:unnamed protein product [Rhizoctonia solani]|uniref:Uncharacterized protein n=1 Tax=Rhizoctonia solani TaxID=456999 RepID=A0A8H3D8X6_9AGAM|nr:unnamed protein product [Rhizoctonia solani]
MPQRTIGTELCGETLLKNMYNMRWSCPSEYGPDSAGKTMQKVLVDITVRAVNPSLVFTSTTILPGYSNDWSKQGPWCFRKDVTYVRNKLDELEAAGDQEAKQSWIERRRNIVEARKKGAEPLKEWLQRLEKEREAGLDRRRLARQAEIKSRLRDLGRDERDIAFQNCNECFSFVYNASPLTEKAWKKSLPKLLKTVEANRKERMASEREDRRDEIYGWAEDVCGPKVLHQLERGWYGTQKLDVMEMLLDNLEILPEIKLLLDEDRLEDEFERDFESQKPKLIDTLTNWVNEQEARLVSMMPNDDPTPDFNLPGPETMEFETNNDPTPLPMTALSINTQKLLRADAIFTRTPINIKRPSASSSTCYFYPDFDALPSEFTYSSMASEIARTFLTSLGRPNASRLEMTATGCALNCGMCPEIRSLGWKDLIEHCLKEHWLDEPEQEIIISEPNKSTADVVSSDSSDLSSDLSSNLSDISTDLSALETDSEGDQYLEG